MYAIVKTGGKQYTVEQGDVFDVEKLPGEPGDKVSLDVLFLHDGDTVITDADKLAKTKVTAKIVEQHRGDKVIVFKFKRRKGYRRLRGHRQQLTRIEITQIGDGKSSSSKQASTAKKEPAKTASKSTAAKKEPAKTASKSTAAKKEPAKTTGTSAAAKKEPAKTASKPAASKTTAAKKEPAKTAAKKETASKPAAKKEPAKKPAAKADTSDDLSKMTVAQLKDLAKEKGVKIPSSARKADIIDLLKNA